MRFRHVSIEISSLKFFTRKFSRQKTFFFFWFDFHLFTFTLISKHLTIFIKSRVCVRVWISFGVSHFGCWVVGEKKNGDGCENQQHHQNFSFTKLMYGRSSFLSTKQYMTFTDSLFMMCQYLVCFPSILRFDPIRFHLLFQKANKAKILCCFIKCILFHVCVCCSPKTENQKSDHCFNRTQ